MDVEQNILPFVQDIDEAIVLCKWNENSTLETTFLNDSIELFIGEKYEKKKVSEFELKKFIHTEDKAKYEQYVQKLIDGSARERGQFRILNKVSGKFIWAELQGKTRVEENGQMNVFHLLRNIDFRVQSENLLRQSEEKHRLLFTRANDAIFIIKNLQIVDCNEKTLSMFESPGYSGVSGKELYRFMPESQGGGTDSILNFHYLVQETLKGNPQFFDWIFSKFGGEQFDSEVSLSGFKLGEDDFVQVIVRDITARKKAEQEELRARLAEKENVALEKEIEDRKKAEYELTEARQYSDSIINSSLDIIIASDKQGKITEFNKAAREVFGYNNSQILGRGVESLLKNKEDGPALVKRIVEDGYFRGEMIAKTKSGKSFSAYISASKLINNEGESIGTVGVVKDISELKKSEQKLKESVEQKEVLLREVHHRVKNNLQVINSILKLQSSFIDDNKAILAMSECQDRIKSMAFIHESLYQSNDLAKVNFSDYLSTLCNNLLYSYQVDREKVLLNLNVSKISLSLDTGISCGLIVNELISNALKYAFVKQDEGQIVVSLEKKGKSHVLIVEDNGAGFPSTVDYRNTHSLGLQLVLGLVDQIDGEIQLKKGGGTKFIITFNRP